MKRGHLLPSFGTEGLEALHTIVVQLRGLQATIIHIVRQPRVRGFVMTCMR